MDIHFLSAGQNFLAYSKSECITKSNKRKFTFRLFRK